MKREVAIFVEEQRSKKYLIDVDKCSNVIETSCAKDKEKGNLLVVECLLLKTVFYV